MPSFSFRGSITALAAVVFAVGCSPSDFTEGEKPTGPVELFDGRVIPAMPELLGLRDQYDLRLGWLEDKHRILLDLMRDQDIDMWIVVSEEFHADPVMQYVAPPLQYTRRRDVLVFVDDGTDDVRGFSDYWRPTADYARFIEPMPSARNERGIQDTASGLRALWEQYDPARVALNIGGARGQDSGLTHDSYAFLLETLGPAAEHGLVRRTSSRQVSDASFAYEYAYAGPCHAERCAIRRSRAQAGRAQYP